MKHAFIAMLAVLCCLAPPLVRARRRTDWVNDQGETCVMSACEEHWPGLPDKDCCAVTMSAYCADGYTVEHIDDSCMQPSLAWWMSLAMKSRPGFWRPDWPIWMRNAANP